MCECSGFTRKDLLCYKCESHAADAVFRHICALISDDLGASVPFSMRSMLLGGLMCQLRLCI